MVVDSAITDTEERRRITTDLSSSMFVEAGAGTGKTSVLVDRVVALITRGEATIDQIVGITFTRSAASELRERVALRLEVESVKRNIDEIPNDISKYQLFFSKICISKPVVIR